VIALLNSGVIILSLIAVAVSITLTSGLFVIIMLCKYNDRLKDGYDERRRERIANQD
jgi:hypothetical protein